MRCTSTTTAMATTWSIAAIGGSASRSRSSCSDQGLLGRALQALDGPLPPQGLGLRAAGLAVNHHQGPAAPGVLGSLAHLVLLQPRLHIQRDAAVERVVSATEQVQPPGHGAPFHDAG